MSVDDARCPTCGAIPELVRGAWWPHKPGPACPPVTTCADGLHVHPHGGGRCVCGETVLGDPRPEPAETPWWMEA